MINKYNPTEKEALQRILEIAKSNIEIESPFDIECLEKVGYFIKYYEEIMMTKGYQVEES